MIFARESWDRSPGFAVLASRRRVSMPTAASGHQCSTFRTAHGRENPCEEFTSPNLDALNAPEAQTAIFSRSGIYPPCAFEHAPGMAEGSRTTR